MKKISIEQLPNGFIRIYDYSSQWSCLYTSEGKHHCGPASDLPEYRAEVRKFLNNS